jgi:hypothetical protein
VAAVAAGLSDRVKVLLAETEERRQRYSRRAAQLEWLYLTLFASTAVLLFFGGVVYLYGYDYRPLFVVGATFSIAGYVAYILHIIYDGKAAEAARQVCELKCMLGLSGGT